MPTPSSTLTHNTLGVLAPKFADITDRVLFDDIWQRPELSARERSIVTVAAMVALYQPDLLTFHLERAQSNGVSQNELAEIITHLAFYAGWPAAHSALRRLQDLPSSAKE